MSAPDDDSPEAFQATIRNALLKSFAIPLGVLVFFAAAPAWLNHNLHAELEAAIIRDAPDSAEAARRTEAFAQVDLAQVAYGAPTPYEGLRTSLENAGVGGQFRRLRLGFWLSAALVVLMAGSAAAVHSLNRRAGRSRADLIAAYRQAWRISVGTAIAKVLLLIPLLAYGTFELTTLAFERYLPKLILVIVVGGLVALWRSIATLVKPVPLEFEAPLARPVTPAEAPKLWADTRAAAARLGTAPPDHIVIGMEHNFYVTEFAVKHAGGTLAGRTLFLSLPLMRQLAPAEVLAIIGHELGHFRGEDTRISREFHPLRHKALATLHAMAEAGWVGWASVHSLVHFHGSFARTEQAMSRERELLADRAAAELTSPGVAASALTRIHVFAEAFARSLRGGAADPFLVPLAAYTRDHLVGEPEFWQKLFERKAAHPLDSHPSLRVRLEALGQPVDAELAKTVSTAGGDTAAALWLDGLDALFAGLQAEAQKLVGRAQAASADYATPAGRALLDQHFPEIRWPASARPLWFRVGVCSFGAALSLFLLVVIDGWPLKLMMLGFAAICALPAVLQWRRHRHGEFVLTAGSLQYTGWHRPLLFADIANVTAKSEYGAITVTFHLKAKDRGIWKYGPFGWIPTRSVDLALALIPGKQKENLQTIVRYLSRDLGA